MYQTSGLKVLNNVTPQFILSSALDSSFTNSEVRLKKKRDFKNSFIIKNIYII